jgi:hypothetical protein
MQRIPANSRRVNHYSIVFDPTGEEIQLNEVREENKNLKRRLVRLEEALTQLVGEKNGK